MNIVNCSYLHKNNVQKKKTIKTKKKIIIKTFAYKKEKKKKILKSSTYLQSAIVLKVNIILENFL